MKKRLSEQFLRFKILLRSDSWDKFGLWEADFINFFMGVVADHPLFHFLVKFS